MIKVQKMKRNWTKVLSYLLVGTMLIIMTSCAKEKTLIQAGNLMAEISADEVSSRTPDDQFIGNTADFSFDLFKETIAEKENSLVSPLSVMLALAMTANGADSETLEEMAQVLGKDLTLNELNEYLYSYANSLPSEVKSKLQIANSIWLSEDEDRLVVEKEFLKVNASYYGAAAYKSAFDDQTIKDINSWVETNTDGMIDKILEQINEDAIMYLINAIVFDAEWKNAYKLNEIASGDFTAIDGSTQTADYMNSEEDTYLDDGRATGFIKPYANGHYSFVALLPNEDVDILDYIATLSGEGFLKTIKEAEKTAVTAALPKYSYAYTVTMNDALKAIGMPKAFSADEADFSKLGKSSRGNIYIGEVLHKTFISVDELGTKAGAVTKVEMREESYMETKIVKLERPFVYAIIDNATNLPVFIGAVMSLGK